METFKQLVYLVIAFIALPILLPLIFILFLVAGLYFSFRKVGTYNG